MIVTKEELINIKKDLLKKMDIFIKQEIADESIICGVWLAGGLPDGYDELDLLDIASDDELWLDTNKCFVKCCKLAGLL